MMNWRPRGMSGPRPPLGVGRHQSASRTMITCPKPDVPDISAGYATKSRNKEFRAGKALCPSGQITSPNQKSWHECQPLVRKIFSFRFSEERDYLPSSRVRQRDVSRSSRTLDAGCDGREGVQRGLPRRRKHSSRTSEIVRSRRPDAGVNPRVTSPGGRRLTSRVLRGDHV